MKQKILIIAGGTGGHVFPAICLALELLDRQHKILFLTDKRGCKYLKQYPNIPIKIMTLDKKYDGLLGKGLFLSQMFISFIQSFFIH